MNTKTCKKCNNNFKPKRSSQVFCSVECHHTRGSYEETKLCVRDECSNTFAVNSRTARKVYCSSRCAAIVNNKLYPKRISDSSDKTSTGNRSKKCKVCGDLVSYWRSYCDQHKYGHTSRREKRIYSWLTGDWDGSKSSGDLSRIVRSYLIEQADYACEKCGFDTPHPDGLSILQIDHIDGDGSNNSRSNLRVLCPNCHALTPTFGARNIGKGRKYRRDQYNRKTNTN